MNYENILLEKEIPIAIISINRPDRLNTLSIKTLEELSDAFSSLLNDVEINVVILTGIGSKAFAAGADITELNKLDRLSGKEFAVKGQEIFNLIENFEKPVIAAVNGYALGGGCELALACHFRLASDNAKFGQPEVNLGLIPGFGGTQRLARLINTGRALEYILSGDIIDSGEAYRLGLANKVYPQSELILKAKELAIKISSKGQVAVKAAIRAVNGIKNLTQEQGLTLEAELFGLCCGSEDSKEGTIAFLEKRKPAFKNR
jgi:enoyl-CoA hydratase